MKTKKIISAFLVALLLVTALLATTACNPFKHGYEKEVPGIYGIKTLFYKDINGVFHSFGEKYDYFLIVLYADKTAKIISKKVDDEEKIFETTYALIFDEESTNIVKYVTIQNFDVIGATETTPGNPVFMEGTAENIQFSLRPMLENLVNTDYDYRIIDKHLKSSKMKYTFHKIYDRTTDRKIARAEKKQIRSRESREKKNPENDDEE